jgi:cytochrome c oxidase subunit 2
MVDDRKRHSKAEVLTYRRKMGQSMTSRRSIVLLAGTAGLALVTVPVAAAQPPSITARLIQELSNRLLIVAIPVTLLTEGFLFYAILKFRKNDSPTPTVENRRLEVSWTIATAVLLAFVGISAYSVMGQPFVTPTENTAEQRIETENPVVVNVTGAQWLWTFHYPQHNVTMQNKMVLPANRSIVLRITSSDVIHSVHVPKLGLKRDAIPGQTTYIATKLNSSAVGNTYTLYCAEYCGRAHSNMLADIQVVSQQKYQDWLKKQGGSNSSSVETDASLKGEVV